MPPTPNAAGAEIADNADDFERAVQACFAQVSPLLPAGLVSYVIDFVVDPATYTCRVVELNPFDVQYVVWPSDRVGLSSYQHH